MRRPESNHVAADDPAASRLVAPAARGVVPVVLFSSRERARRAIDLLRRADFRTFEVTLTVPGAVALIG